jgi:hypothetical protein
MREKKVKKFPCKYCKGTGIIENGEFNDDGLQISPNIECSNCDGEGMIEIGGNVHLRIKAFNIGCDILWALGRNKGKAFTYNHIVRIGKKALLLSQPPIKGRTKE